ncbi:tRNA (adenine(22)-N(1))-methyltransferase [Paenibacillus bovis]|uniref:SAM-dependent methyltransferase n=1 Tax=Paenibacillus bovis TaxID=1616788 RepID=A0A172ZJY1_9BACL|nr:tRNA (adenine(22)-N(1))-methyltransferase TrmK [Paenibacillus bovis]ANF97722.1 SAM-dependent methyltransferase [Paenibacillus bovis]
MKLSTRLTRIAEQIPAGSRLADIGSDHALLPVFAVRQGRVTQAVAGEVNQGPLDAAQRQVNEAGLSQVIEPRLGNGLAVLHPGEVDVITIAGMGGALIVTILSEGLDKLEGVSRLILQPNVGEEFVRRWLLEHGWFLSSEQILEEDGRTYEILTADRLADAAERNVQLYQERLLTGPEGLQVELHDFSLLQFGPYLLNEASTVFIDKWKQEIDKLEKVAASVGRSDTDEAKLKVAALQQQIKLVKEVLLCLQKDRP